ncbi:hypothetical protein TURU_128901 [Turdus rufiventris]|nr:hypothetical protein TURU_128901 [Turdus rufiventris]
MLSLDEGLGNYLQLCKGEGCTISLLQAENDDGPALAEDGLWLLEQEGLSSAKNASSHLEKEVFLSADTANKVSGHQRPFRLGSPEAMVIECVVGQSQTQLSPFRVA